MREMMGLVRASWRSALSYRMGMLLSLASLLLTVVPVYFIARALQGVMANAIRNQGGEYFSFLLVGMIVFAFLNTAVSDLPSSIGSSIGNGTLEALLSTRAPIAAVLGGLVGYSFIWTAIRGLVLLAAGAVLGAHIVWPHFFTAVGILVLIVLAYLPFGLLGASLILAFRTTGPLLQGVIVASGLLGGVYYPSDVIPSWLYRLSEFVPLTYGLRALRRTLLEGVPLSAVASDLGMLLGFVVLLGALSVVLFSEALRYARGSGSLAQY
jgi:ABC-2 type transport system permease protein